MAILRQSYVKATGQRSHTNPLCKMTHVWFNTNVFANNDKTIVLCLAQSAVLSDLMGYMVNFQIMS